MKHFLFILILFFTILTFFKPSGFDALGMNSINTFFNISRIVVTIIISIVYFSGKKYHSKLLKYLFFYFCVSFFSTYIHGLKLSIVIILSGSAIGFAMLTEIMIKKNLRLFLKVLLYIYFILIVFNLFWMISVVGFTVNIEEVYGEDSLQNMVVCFLSNANLSASFFIPGMLIATLNLFMSSKYNLISWILLISTFLSGLILWSATSLVGESIILLFSICILFNIEQIFIRYVKPIVLLFLSLFISVGVTFFKIQNLFEFLIVDILHKDLTMTGRTTVWNYGFKAFEKSPIIGLGFGNKSVMTCDNCYAQILGDNGMLGFIAFFMLIYFSYKNLFRGKKTKVKYLFTLVAALLFLMFIAESWVNFWGLYILLILFYNIESIDKLIYNSNKKYLA